MSGGHWNYGAQRLRGEGDELRRLYLTLAEVEEALDWGICSDWSMEEAKEVAARLMIAFFDGHMPRRRWDIVDDVRREAREHELAEMAR